MSERLTQMIAPSATTPRSAEERHVGPMGSGVHADRRRDDAEEQRRADLPGGHGRVRRAAEHARSTVRKIA